MCKVFHGSALVPPYHPFPYQWTLPEIKSWIHRRSLPRMVQTWPRSNTIHLCLQTDRYAPLQDQLENKFGEDTKEHIPVKRINIPDLTVPLGLGRQENFSLFIPWHRRMASALIDIFMSEFRTFFVVLECYWQFKKSVNK